VLGGTLDALIPKSLHETEIGFIMYQLLSATKVRKERKKRKNGTTGMESTHSLLR
jgi:hypothetical protein